MIVRHNIYTVSWVSVSKHYVKHGSLTQFWNLRTADFHTMSSPFEVRSLLSHGGSRVIHWYSANAKHVSRDHWRHSQSPTEFANSSRFTGSPVRGSLNTHTGRIAVYGSTELTLPDDSTHPPDSIYTGLRWYFVT